MTCLQAIEGSMGARNVIQLLEVAHTTQNDRLLNECRQYVVEHSAEVKDSGALDELKALGTAKGLLGDVINRCSMLAARVRVSARRVCTVERTV